MLLNLLHVDDALHPQKRFIDLCSALDARETDVADMAKHVRLWGKNAAFESLHSHIALVIRPGKDTVVTFMGSGDFHHVSALLIGMLAEKNNEPFTIIHFDNHPDWVHFSGGMHCGSWVNRALQLPQAQKIITLGPCSRDLVRPRFKGANLQAWRDGKIVLLPWQSPSAHFREYNMDTMDETEFLKRLLPQIATRNVYITIDKDVLSHEDAITNWDQGKMPLSRLLSIVRCILAGHHAIGIDVTGDYSRPVYKGKLRHVALKKLESILDQPRAKTYHATDINQASNLAILNTIREVL